MVSAIVASAGGVEEDLIKVLAPTYMGDFTLPGKGLRDQGMNRIGNLLVLMIIIVSLKNGLFLF